MGKYLLGMHRVTTPGELKALVRRAWKRGTRGLLLSGGFTRDGILPIRPFLSVVRELKRGYGLVVSVHPGLVDRYGAEELRRAGVDIADFELVLSEEVIRRVKGLAGKGPHDYIESLEALHRYGPPYLAPHIPLGLEWGRIASEYEALGVVRDVDPYVTVVLVYRPTPGTPMSNVPPPDVSNVTEFFREARRRLRGELSLGCMRPHSLKAVLDPLLVEQSLIDRIAVPYSNLRQKLGVYEACCSVPREYLDLFLKRPFERGIKGD